ncbi:hypothetical protein [Fimbriiglobus ruber]|uniref:hypothetical protein n=1 Tax=Fimbriiglobus ruber TaxID=1908690 RepID=UPI00117B63B6|nr:hypothetical protein [Fimbriiglobus ruber]
MATLEDAERQNSHLRSLAAVLFAAAESESSSSWIAAVLDARFSDQDGSIMDKVRVEKPDGSVGSISLPTEATLQLIALGDARPSGQDRWYGLLLRVTAEGACDVRFNYEPSCTDDESFYAS